MVYLILHICSILSTIFPILANLCGLPSHHTAGFPTSKAISPNPRQANSQKSVWKKEQIFSFRSENWLTMSPDQANSNTSVWNRKICPSPKTFKYQDLSDRLQRWKHPITKVQQCLEKSLRLIDLHPFSVWFPFLSMTKVCEIF